MIAIAKGTNWYFVGAVIAIFLIIFLLAAVHCCNPGKARDAVRIQRLQGIQFYLDAYYAKNHSFPATLSELREEVPKDPKTHDDYLYAFYPPENPTAYHLGAILEFKNATILTRDSDFNSKAAGYVNGFDGKDPVYDIHISK